MTSVDMIIEQMIVSSFIVVSLYGMWFVFSHTSQFSATILQMDNGLQVFIISIGGCLAPPKYIAIDFDKVSNGASKESMSTIVALVF
jgi:hypothetical protein